MTNQHLSGRTGTETAVADFARELIAQGHRPSVYATQLGPLAEELAQTGVAVTNDLRKLRRPEVIHGHHLLETLAAVRHFPGIPALFVCHDRLAWHDATPRHSQVKRYVAVDENCLERLNENAWMEPARTRVILNAVDLSRFRPRAPLPPKPRRALVFSNYAGAGTHLEPIREACSGLGLPLEVAGEDAGSLWTQPETRLGEFDLVFAKARCALEAMAVGAAVVLCDTRGLGPMVTSAEVARLRRWNFGMRTLTSPLEPELIAGQVLRYDARDASDVSAYVRRHAGLDEAVRQYVDLYEEITQRRAWPAWRDLFSRDYPRTKPLKPRHITRMNLRLGQWPAQVRAGEAFPLAAVLCSHSRRVVATAPPWPALLTLFWRREGSDGRGTEGVRSLVSPPLRRGETRTYAVSATAPSEPGAYVARVTVIQENWSYLDQATPPVYAEARIEVV